MLNKEYGTRVPVSQTTIELVGGKILSKRIGDIEIRGKRRHTLSTGSATAPIANKR